MAKKKKNGIINKSRGEKSPEIQKQKEKATYIF